MDPYEGDPHATTQPPPAPPPTRHARSWPARPLAQPSVQLTVIAWLAGNLAVVLLAQGHLPFQRPLLHNTPYLTQLPSPTSPCSRCSPSSRSPSRSPASA